MTGEPTTVKDALEAWDQKQPTALSLLVGALQEVQETLLEIVQEESLKDTYLAEVLCELLGVDEP